MDTGLKSCLETLPSPARALSLLHFPDVPSDVEVARRRLALDEFVELQRTIRARRLRLQANARPLPCGGTNRLIRPFLAQLGFKLTEAQSRVLREIRNDLGGRQVMRRLLQGDVGSGKTAVAACAALMTLESRYNVALMAPTEILAEQHFETFERWFGPLGVAVGLRTGSRQSKSVNRHTTGLANSIPPNAPRFTIGTHALIEAPVQLDRLGLVIIDEQHKFGVAQRETLVRKGPYPHLLVMTATPIPRTLGLTLYGDLDLSVIDQSPLGRGRIKTFLRSTDKLPKVWDFIRQKLAAGRQAYVVFPRIEESDRADIKAVTVEWKRLCEEFAPAEVGLLHGRMPPAEKRRVMERFRENTCRVLVATSVIEVGIDVPNATIMVIGDADRFGLAQLHQMRGRIGRGAHESHCILIADPGSEEAIERLKVFESTSDGFRIAEEDLRIRGAGELLGRQQSGLPPFRFGDLATDRELIEKARQIAAAVQSAPRSAS
jgi:ATP-dependent DNA helicase RecG